MCEPGRRRTIPPRRIPAYEREILDKVAKTAYEDIQEQEGRNFVAHMDAAIHETRRKIVEELVLMSIAALKKLTKLKLIEYIKRLHKKIKVMQEQIDHYENNVLQHVTTVTEFTWDYLIDAGNRQHLYQMARDLFPSSPLVSERSVEEIAALLLARLGEPQRLCGMFDQFQIRHSSSRTNIDHMKSELVKLRKENERIRRVVDWQGKRAVAFRRALAVDLNPPDPRDFNGLGLFDIERDLNG